MNQTITKAEVALTCVTWTSPDYRSSWATSRPLTRSRSAKAAMETWFAMSELCYRKNLPGSSMMTRSWETLIWMVTMTALKGRSPRTFQNCLQSMRSWLRCRAWMISLLRSSKNKRKRVLRSVSACHVHFKDVITWVMYYLPAHPRNFWHLNNEAGPIKGNLKTQLHPWRSAISIAGATQKKMPSNNITYTLTCSPEKFTATSASWAYLVPLMRKRTLQLWDN